jgi:hypothetical protein
MAGLSDFAAEAFDVAAIPQTLHLQNAFADTGQLRFEQAFGLGHIEGLVLWNGNSKIGWRDRNMFHQISVEAKNFSHRPAKMVTAAGLRPCDIEYTLNVLSINLKHGFGENIDQNWSKKLVIGGLELLISTQFIQYHLRSAEFVETDIPPVDGCADDTVIGSTLLDNLLTLQFRSAIFIEGGRFILFPVKFLLAVKDPVCGDSDQFGPGPLPDLPRTIYQAEEQPYE